MEPEDEEEYECQECTATNDREEPAKPFLAGLLVPRCLFNVLVGIYCVRVCFIDILDDLHELYSLVLSLRVQSLSDSIDVIHQSFHCIQVILSLGNHIAHVLGFLKLFNLHLPSKELLLLPCSHLVLLITKADRTSCESACIRLDELTCSGAKSLTLCIASPSQQSA